MISEILVNGEPVSLVWRTEAGERCRFARVWIAEVSTLAFQQSKYENHPEIRVKIPAGSFAYRGDCAVQAVEFTVAHWPSNDSQWIVRGQMTDEIQLLEMSRKILKAEEQSVRELMELEPNAKWVLLTLAKLLIKLEEYGEARVLLEKLQLIDPARGEFYKKMGKL